MDLRRLRRGEWLAAVSGVVLVVSLFLPWYTASGSDFTAFEAYSIIDVLLLVVGLLGITLLVVTAAQRTAAVGVASDSLLTLVAGAVFVVAALRALDVPGGLEGSERNGFLWIGLAAALGVLVGSVLAMRDERLSKPGRPTDATGMPVAAPPDVDTLPAPPRERAEP